MRMFVNEIRIDTDINTDSYLYNIPSIMSIKDNPLKLKSNITFLVGENGAGKSTLIEAIAVSLGFNAEGGDKNHNFSTKPTHSPLYEYITVARSAYPKNGFFLRAESLYNEITYMEEVDASRYGHVLHRQSHGQTFMEIVSSFGDDGLYILDEPEAALSASKVLELMVRINELSKQNCQFIIATHSPMLVTMPNSTIYKFGDDGISEINYDEYENYTITKAFLECPQRMMKNMFD